MSLTYHITGMVQAGLFLLSISAVYVQLRFVRKRRKLIAQSATEELATDNLSVVAIFGGFAAFLSFLLLSTATVPFAHYIFWSRIPACIFSILLLWEFRRDDTPRGVALLGPVACGLFLLSLAVTALLPGGTRAFIDLLQVAVVGAGILVVSGQLQQFWLLLKERRIGALSLKARTLNLMKDLSTVAFGLALGAHQSWSLILVAAANAAVTALVIHTGMKISRGASKM